MSFKGKKNAYTCEKCNGRFITIDVDDGTTPAFLVCRVTKNCEGRMTSMFYRLRTDIAPHMEWFKPKKIEALRLPAGLRCHVKKGGLILRPVDYSNGG